MRAMCYRFTTYWRTSFYRMIYNKVIARQGNTLIGNKLDEGVCEYLERQRGLFQPPY